MNRNIEKENDERELCLPLWKRISSESAIWRDQFKSKITEVKDQRVQEASESPSCMQPTIHWIGVIFCNRINRSPRR